MFGDRKLVAYRYKLKSINRQQYKWLCILFIEYVCKLVRLIQEKTNVTKVWSIFETAIIICQILVHDVNFPTDYKVHMIAQMANLLYDALSHLFFTTFAILIYGKYVLLALFENLSLAVMFNAFEDIFELAVEWFKDEIYHFSL